MHDKYLQKLEYFPILEEVAKHAKTDLGKEACLSLRPFSDEEKVQQAISETEEAVSLKQRIGMPPISFFEPIDLWIKNLESNRSLSAKALLEMVTVLKMARELKEYFEKEDSIVLPDYPILQALFSALYTNSSIEKQISLAVLDEATIDDHASKNLFHIRKELQSLETQIKEKLNHFLHSTTYSKYLQENVVTIRNGRYVIPVKEEYRSQIKGFAHDFSSSGSTVFIEPMSIFDMNNKMADLKREETIEIEKILQQLSLLFMPITENMKSNKEIISKLDFIFAKASYAFEINATKPMMQKEKIIKLTKARHPLIAKDKVVPIDFALGKDYQTLVITGPNTGGKTVTLKTVGLLCLMAQSGLYIPAKENSKLYPFDSIFADIGDEQSIQASLSTFSSHMLNIIDILKEASKDNLVLVDELGSGTDPIEGSSLAISILEAFFQKGALTVATTHYPEIKNYALTHSGFENASCEFDIETLSPTYKLLIGIPGKSNAFAISQKLGLPENILTRAKDFLSPDHISIEELLKGIYDNKQAIEKEKEETEKNLRQAESLRKSLQRDFTALEEKQKEKIENAKLEARQILSDAKDEATRLIRDLSSLKAKNEDSITKANQIRNTLNEDMKKLATSYQTKTNTKMLDSDSLWIGMPVFVTTVMQEGTVLSLPNKEKEVQVQVGMMKMTVSIPNLAPSNSQKKKPTITKKKPSNTLKASQVASEINVIGQTVEEANFVIDKYLDDCALSGLSTVRIVHGKGTGKLREGIHAFLKKHPHVKSFRLGTFGEGEMGVTVVELK